jgi:crotonobetainyl-CoA:carnitine CoA-transferase CaiB-like acyl-CoA transferase
MRPLDGLVVLNLARLLPGDAAAGLLASFGARIIPLQLPDVDLKTPAGTAALLDLVEDADVLLESFRPGVMGRFGLDYETLRARNPRLIYVAITGYGQDGPCSGFAGHDINYLSLAGVLDVTGVKDGPPVIPGVQIADLAGGSMQAVIGILLALVARQKTGLGQMVDVSMHRGALWTMAIPFLLQRSARPTARGDALLTGRYACYHLYQAADGRWVAVGALEQKFWANLCRALGCEQFIPDQFTEGPRRQEIIDALAAIFRTRTAEEWFDRLQNCDACVTPVRSVAEVVREFGDKVPVIPKLCGEAK